MSKLRIHTLFEAPMVVMFFLYFFSFYACDVVNHNALFIEHLVVNYVFSFFMIIALVLPLRRKNELFCSDFFFFIFTKLNGIDEYQDI